MRRGTPRRWATVVAAMASVGETIAPRTKAAAHGSPATVWTTAATTKVVIKHEPYREERDRPDVGPKVAPRGKERRDVQQRRQEQQEHELRVEPHPRKTGHEPEHRTTEDEQDRVRYLEPRGERGQRRHSHQKADDYLNLGQSSPSFLPIPPVQTNRSVMSWVTSANSPSSPRSVCICSLSISLPSCSRSLTSTETMYS